MRRYSRDVSDSWGLALLVFGPAVLGLLALGGGIALLASGREGERHSVVRIAASVVLLVVALGIGGCYAVMFLGA